jgi:putative hemolysin
MQNLVTATNLSLPQRTRGAPDIEIADGRYLVRFARNAAEIDAALKLRFEVFNLELQEGLESSLQTGRDRDEFDASCDHLIAVDRANEKVIGTYRLRTIEMAGAANGFYSAAEFDLSRLPREVLDQSVELGRACIAQNHRHRQVLFLLWKALARYLVTMRKRFLFGCCSLTSQDPCEGNQLLKQLTEKGFLHPTIDVQVRHGYECRVDGAEEYRCAQVKLPKLFSAYLNIGAVVCSSPAIDRRFKTIDFLVLFDVEGMNARSRRLFFSA